MSISEAATSHLRSPMLTCSLVARPRGNQQHTFPPSSPSDHSEFLDVMLCLVCVCVCVVPRIIAPEVGSYLSLSLSLPLPSRKLDGAEAQINNNDELTLLSRMAPAKLPSDIILWCAQDPIETSIWTGEAQVDTSISDSDRDYLVPSTTIHLIHPVPLLPEACIEATINIRLFRSLVVPTYLTLLDPIPPPPPSPTIKACFFGRHATPRYLTMYSGVDNMMDASGGRWSRIALPAYLEMTDHVSCIIDPDTICAGPFLSSVCCGLLSGTVSYPIVAGWPPLLLLLLLLLLLRCTHYRCDPRFVPSSRNRKAASAILDVLARYFRSCTRHIITATTPL